MRSPESSGPGDDRGVDDELSFHIEMQTRRYVAAGLDPVAARARAVRRLGDLDRTRLACRAILDETGERMTGSAWHVGLWQDAAYAARMLRRAPLFAITALLTMAVGIGATAAIFSVVNAVLLRGVPYGDADGLVVIWNSYATGLDEASIAPAEFADIKEMQRAFEGVAAIRYQATALTGACAAGDCEPENVAAYVVSPALFDLLRVQPAIGRSFSDADGVAGAERVVLMSDALWRRRFGADPAIVGRTITAGGLPRVVIGILPPGVRFPDAPISYVKRPGDLWIPHHWEQARAEGRGNQYLALIARLGPDATPERGQADLERIAETFKTEFPARYAKSATGWRLRLVPLTTQILGETRPALLVLFGAVGLVLLIACANVANLLLARGSARHRELAVRAALGASRGRLVRQGLVETLLLVGIGGMAGIALAAVGLQLLPGLDPGDIPLLTNARLDGRVLAFTLATTVLTGLLVGLAPALRQSHLDPQPALAEDGARGGSSGPVRHRARRALVVAEVALAVIVLVGAGLLIRSFARMQRIELGFDAENTTVAQVTLPRVRYDTAARIYGFHRDYTQRLRGLPGIISAAAVYPLPMSGDGWSGTLYVEGFAPGPSDPEPHAEYAVATPDYFRTLGIRLIEGREFTGQDDAGASPVAIIDETLARKYWPGQSAVGKRLSPWQAPKDNAWTTVVGVVAHVRNQGHRAAGEPQVYLSAFQKAEMLLYYVARSRDRSGSLPSMRTALGGIDGALPITKLAYGRDLVAQLVARERFNLLLITVFGGIALALAAIGLYGVIAVLAIERTREIGIRLALGGSPARIVAAIVREGVALSAVGVAAGLIAAVALSQTMTGMLFETTPTDPATYAAIAGLLIVISVAACAIPAHRASRVDPVSVMK